MLAEKLIRLALIDACVIAAGSTPSTAQYAEGIERLNDVVKHLLITNSTKLYVETTADITLVQGQAAYTLNTGGSVNIAKPTKVIEAYFHDVGDTAGRKLTKLSSDEIRSLPDQVTEGPITGYNWLSTSAVLTVTLYRPPDLDASTGLVRVSYQAQVNTITATGQTLLMPEEAILAIRWSLASDFSSGKPTAIVNLCALKKKEFVDAWEDFDTDDTSVKFQPDPQYYPGNRGFR